LIAAAKLRLLLVHVQGVFNCSSPFSVPRSAEPNGGLCYVDFFLKRELLLAVTYSSFWYRKLGGIVKNHPVRFFHQVQSCSAKVVNGWLVVG